MSTTESNGLRRRVTAEEAQVFAKEDKRRWLRRRTWPVARPYLIALYTLKLLESYGYFVVTISLTVFLTDEMGFSDIDAGWIYGGFGVATSILGVICGPMIDRLGVRWSILSGGFISLVGRFLIAMPVSQEITLLNLFFLLPLGIALGIPVMTIAVKRYTNSSTQVDGYSFFYSVMNIAALIAGATTDAFRHGAKEGTELFGISFTPLRLLFLSGWVAAAVMVIVAFFGLEEVQVNEQGKVVQFSKLLVKEPLGRSIRNVCKARAFWTLMMYSAVISFARMVFRHLDATFPKYMLREFGPDVIYGTIYALNPLVVIVASVLIGKATDQRVSPYNMCIIGSLTTALSVVPLLFGASYATSISFIVLLSLGEAAYSPRVYQFTMDQAPRGHEGFYTSLSSAPFFVGKLFAGGLSGGLLDAFCPADPPRECEVMWGIVGSITLVSPILLLALRGVLDVPGEDAEAPGGGQAQAARDEASTEAERTPLTEEQVAGDPTP